MTTLVRCLPPDHLAVWPGSLALHVETPESETRPRLVGGHYRLEERIGIGGMSIVYQGTQLGTERPVAVKVLRPELSTKPDVLARFQNEARVTARCAAITSSPSWTLVISKVEGPSWCSNTSKERT